MRLILILTSLLFSANSLACIVPRGDLSHEPALLITQAKTIVWAKAISHNPALTVKHANSPATYQFEVIEVLKGSNLGGFVTLDGDADLSGLWDTTFTNHAEREFVNHHDGRLGNVGDCTTTPAPEFKLGSKYVLILGGVDDSKNYERVDNQQDRWYQLIKTELTNGK